MCFPQRWLQDNKSWPLDLDFLDLSRLYDAPGSRNKIEEDELCAHLQQFDPV